MDGQELSAKLRPLSREQLRRVYRQAALELGVLPKRAHLVIDADRQDAPWELTFKLVWHLYCEKRVFAPTGRRQWDPPTFTGSAGRYVREMDCDWSESAAAVARCLAAADAPNRAAPAARAPGAGPCVGLAGSR